MCSITTLIGYIFWVLVIFFAGFFMGKRVEVKKLHDDGYLGDDEYDHIIDH